LPTVSWPLVPMLPLAALLFDTVTCWVPMIPPFAKSGRP
jgi:hypothetical protein